MDAPAPLYYTLTSVCPYDGQSTIYAVCESIDAAMYRLKQCHITSGDEYRLEAFELTKFEQAYQAYQDRVLERITAQQKRDQAKQAELEQAKAALAAEAAKEGKPKAKKS